MLLVLPDVSLTPGPTWAGQLNTALELIDTHDHTSGHGVKVPIAGINFNADMSLGSHALLSASKLTLVTQGSDPVLPGAVYVKGGDLYFTATNLTPVQITDGTAIKGTSGNISGLGAGGSSAAFNDFTEDFSFKFNSGNKYAAFNIGDLRVFPFDGVNAYANPVTIHADIALASPYTMTLPLSLPLLDNVLSITSTGTMKQGLGNGSAAAPSMSFAADTTTGLYRIGASNLGISIAGTKALDLNATRLQVVGATSATVPSIVPGSGTTTGMGVNGTSLYLISNGVTAATFLNANTTLAGTLDVTGALTAPSINTSGGGAVKIKKVSGTFSAFTAVTVTAGTKVLGACAVISQGGSNVLPVTVNEFEADAASAFAYWRMTGGGLNNVEVYNNTGVSREYAITVFYE